MAGASSLFFIRSLLISRFATVSRHALSVSPRSPRLPSLPLTCYSTPCLRLHVNGQHPPRSFISTKTAPEVDSSAKTESHDSVVPEEMEDEELARDDGWRVFKLWMTKYNKTYENNAEKMRRFEIFKGTLKRVKNPNLLPNCFADQSIEEMDQRCGAFPNLKKFRKMKDEEWRLFKLWMAKFNKTYEDNAEKMRRFEIFKGNLKYVKNPNLLPNCFADQSREEMHQRCGSFGRLRRGWRVN